MIRYEMPRLERSEVVEGVRILAYCSRKPGSKWWYTMTLPSSRGLHVSEDGPYTSAGRALRAARTQLTAHFADERRLGRML